MKKILWTSAFVILLVTIGAVLGLRQLTYAQMPDIKTAAQFALDHSALFKIQTAKDYTAGPHSYVFLGEDKIGRKIMVFATQSSVLGTEYQDKGLSEERAKEKARQVAGLTEIESITPGITDPSGKSPIRSDSKYVWEVYGTTAKGEMKYVYLDFYKGTEIWSYTLNQSK